MKQGKNVLEECHQERNVRTSASTSVRGRGRGQGRGRARGIGKGRGRDRGRGRGRGRGDTEVRGGGGQESQGRTRGLGRGRQQENSVLVQGHPGTFVAKSGRVRSIEPPAPRRRAPQNIIRQRPCTKPNSRKETIAETFSLFLTPAIKRKMIKLTKEEGALVYVSWNEKTQRNRTKNSKN